MAAPMQKAADLINAGRAGVAVARQQAGAANAALLSFRGLASAEPDGFAHIERVRTSQDQLDDAIAGSRAATQTWIAAQPDVEATAKRLADLVAKSKAESLRFWNDGDQQASREALQLANETNELLISYRNSWLLAGQELVNWGNALAPWHHGVIRMLAQLNTFSAAWQAAVNQRATQGLIQLMAEQAELNQEQTRILGEINKLDGMQNDAIGKNAGDLRGMGVFGGITLLGLAALAALVISRRGH